eukprot:CAMPEP_0178938776 /NCGR_PEP_ID=MMETSP0786-20121207/26517_1 /TAXON_ID=186022 /ORGANISM="Thalassionema frauenfeldii, Strain CCMP 1798" /LENGTH=109 /DNA_ID=CAMNT_0020617529 /DNA_START=532 /DNA_END=861 /DNA_ORIENTATION=+
MEDGLPTWDMARNVRREMMKFKNGKMPGRKKLRTHAYNIYVKENYKAFAAKLPAESASPEVIKLISVGWNSLTETEKQNYIDKALAEREEERQRQLSNATAEKKSDYNG